MLAWFLASHCSNRVAAENQIQDQDQQENAADAESTAVTISPITETAAKQQQQNQDDQDQVHSALSLFSALLSVPGYGLRCGANG